MGNLLTMLPRGFFLASSPTLGAASSPTADDAFSPTADDDSSPTPDDGMELAGVEAPLSTGQAARRRRKRLNRKRADIGASSSGAHELNAATPDANPNAKNDDSDAKNGDSSGIPGLNAARTAASAEVASSTGAADPEIAEPASMGIGFLLDASSVAGHDGLHGAALAVAATSTDQEWTMVPEKKRRAPPAPPRTQPRRPAAAATRSPSFAARAPPAPARTLPHLPAAPAARSPAFPPHPAAAVGQQRLPAAPAVRSPAFGLRGTPAPATTRPHLPAASAACSPAFAPRAPAAAAVGQQRAHATPAVGLLDHLHGVESMFGNLFQEAEDDHNCRMIHLRYRAACSTIESRFTCCLVCFLDDQSEKVIKVQDTFDQMKKHLRAKHSHKKAQWNKCPKKGCYTMAAAADIALHRDYCH